MDETKQVLKKGLGCPLKHVYYGCQGLSNVSLYELPIALGGAEAYLSCKPVPWKFSLEYKTNCKLNGKIN